MAVRRLHLMRAAGLMPFPGNPNPATGKRIRFDCILICLLLLIPAACERKKAQKSASPPPTVSVSQPLREDVTDYHEYTGNTQAVNTVQLRARVEGFLDGVYFRDGDVVKKDQLLFLIQQNTYFAQLQQAEGNVLTQKALLEHAKIEYERYSRLLQQRAAAATDVENWRYQRDSAQAALVSAEAQRDLAKLNLAYTWVLAPFTGRIDRRLVDPGNLVGNTGGTTTLAEITQVDPLYVYFAASETDVAPIIRTSSPLSAELRGKQQSTKLPVFVGLSKDTEFPHEGFLDFSSSTVNTTTGTLLLRGSIPNPDGKILPGQFVRVKIPVAEIRSALLLPMKAISYDQLGPYVLIANQNNTVERRDVKTGIQKGTMRVIQEGLKGDESVIVKGMLRTGPGKQVTPERVEIREQSETDSAALTGQKVQ